MMHIYKQQPPHCVALGPLGDDGGSGFFLGSGGKWAPQNLDSTWIQLDTHGSPSWLGFTVIRTTLR